MRDGRLDEHERWIYLDAEAPAVGEGADSAMRAMVRVVVAKKRDSIEGWICRSGRQTWMIGQT